MRPAKDILFDFIRSGVDTGWPITLLSIYNKYLNYDTKDKSKFIEEVSIISQLSLEQINNLPEVITERNIQKKQQLIEKIQRDNIKDNEDSKKLKEKTDKNRKQYLNILLVGQLPEPVYWLAAALPIKNLIIFLDIRDISPNFIYVVSELKKRDLPINIIYRVDNLLDVDEYDLVIQGPSKTSVKVLTDAVISLY